MREMGLVVAVDQKNAQVRFERSAACSKCRACGMLADAKEIIISVENTLSAKVGDSVEIDMQTKGVMMASAIVYVIPLIALFLGLFVGPVITKLLGLALDEDMSAGVCALVFIGISWLTLKGIDAKLRKKTYLLPQMNAIPRVDNK